MISTFQFWEEINFYCPRAPDAAFFIFYFPSVKGTRGRYIRKRLSRLISSRPKLGNAIASDAITFRAIPTILMGIIFRRLQALVLFALAVATIVTGQRTYSRFRNPEGFNFREHGFREVTNFSFQKIELLNCTYNEGQMMCVPKEQCPESRFNQRQQFCRWVQGNGVPFRGPGVCCHVSRYYTHNKPLKLDSSTSIPQIRESDDFENPYMKSQSHGLNSKSATLGNRSNAEYSKDCGILEIDERMGTKIIGGSGHQQILGAAIGGISLPSASESPWTVVIGEFSKDGSVDWFCGGSLLNQLTVLTAAHCARRRKPEIVRVGEVDLRRNTKLGEGRGEETKVKQVIMHPDYHPPSFYNDIAILILERAVTLNRPGGARSICLPRKFEKEDTYNGREAILTGWGHLSFGGERSPILQKVHVTIFSNEECSRSYTSTSAAIVTKRSYPSGIINSQLCAGDRQGKKDACQGDSGGPLVVKDKNGRYSLIGVISSGIGCGSKQYPGVYVRVSSYIDWILSNIKL